MDGAGPAVRPVAQADSLEGRIRRVAQEQRHVPVWLPEVGLQAGFRYAGHASEWIEQGVHAAVLGRAEWRKSKKAPQALRRPSRPRSRSLGTASRKPRSR